MTKKTIILHLTNEKIESYAREVAFALEQGSVGIVPTDTIYGIISLDTMKRSLKRIYKIKHRPSNKPFIRLIGDVGVISEYTNQKLPDELRPYWPGPLTVVFRAKDGGTVAIRYPDDPFLKALFSHLSHPVIVAPSANISGEEEILNCEAIISVFFKKVDFIVCAEKKYIKKRASTIVDISTPPNNRIIRQGDLVVSI